MVLMSLIQGQRLAFCCNAVPLSGSVKCEQEGNYMEAERALKQHTTLRKRESKRVMNAVKARHQQERADVQAAHEAQFNDFNAAWDQYLEEYDQKAQMYVRQMTENHQEQLREFQEKLNEVREAFLLFVPSTTLGYYMEFICRSFAVGLLCLVVFSRAGHAQAASQVQSGAAGLAPAGANACTAEKVCRGTESETHCG